MMSVPGQQPKTPSKVLVTQTSPSTTQVTGRAAMELVASRTKFVCV